MQTRSAFLAWRISAEKWNAFFHSIQASDSLPVRAREACVQLCLMKWKMPGREEAKDLANCSNTACFQNVTPCAACKVTGRKHASLTWTITATGCFSCPPQNKAYCFSYSVIFKAQMSGHIGWNVPAHALYVNDLESCRIHCSSDLKPCLFLFLQHYLPSRPNQRLSLTTV